MRTEGTHILLEYWWCDPIILDDRASIRILMQEAAQATGARIVETVCTPYVPQGISVVVVIEESHLSIHTWPEASYAAVDLFTCGTKCKPEKAHEVLVKGLNAQQHKMMKILRGIPSAPYLRVLSPD